MRHFLFSLVGFYFSLLNGYGLTVFKSAVQGFFYGAPEQIISENQESVRKSSAMWRPTAEEYYQGVSLESKNGVRSFGPAKMYRHRGLWVMELEGSREKVAYQRGALIKDMIDETAFYYYRDRIDRAIEQSLVVRDFGFTEGFIKYYVDHAIFDSLRSNLSSEDKDVLRAFSKATGLSQTDVERTMVLPDASQWLLAKVYGKQSLYKGFFGSIPGLGCSSFFVPKEKSSDGVLLSRNLDYEGADHFDRNQVVVYVRPEMGSEDLTYVNFSTLATPLGVLTAINESGLMLAVHQLMVNSVSKKATPLLSITDHVIRGARGIDEAIEILGSYSQYAGTWRLVLASSKENRSVAVDMADDELVIHEMSSTTNSAVSEKMQENEFSIGFNYFTDSQFRKQNLNQALVERESLDLQGAVDLIAGNQFYNAPENKWQRRDYYGVVSKKNNVQSLVLAPDQGVAYVAVPDMRFALPTMGSYVPVSLNFSKDVSLQNKLLQTQETIKKSEAVDDHEQVSVAAYREASILIGEYGDYDRALELLDKAREQSPENSLYPLMQGFVYFSYAAYHKDNWKNLLTRGVKLLEAAEALGLTHYQQSLVYLYKARHEALLRNRHEALVWVSKIDLSLHSELTKAAEKLKSGRYALKNLRSPLLDFTNADFFKF